MFRIAFGLLLLASLMTQASSVSAQRPGYLGPELTVARVSSMGTTFLVSTFGSDALETVIFDGSNLTANGDDPSLTYLGNSSWTFTVGIDPTNVHEARLVLSDGGTIDIAIDGADLQMYRERRFAVEQDTRNTVQGVKSWVAKTALKGLAKMLRSSSLRTVLNKARDYGGREVADVVERHAYRIADKLDDLARWETVAYEAVQDQVANVLMNAGVKGTLARQVGFVIKTIISALF